MHDESGRSRLSRERPVRSSLAKKVSQSFSPQATRKELAAAIRFARRTAPRIASNCCPVAWLNLACNHISVSRFAKNDGADADMLKRLHSEFRRRPALDLEEGKQYAYQEACCNKQRRFESDGQIAEFVVTTAKRYLCRQIKRDDRKVRLTKAHEPTTPGSEPTPKRGDGLAWIEGSGRLARVWRTLSEREQVVVRRRRYDGASYDEIARELGIRPDNARQIYSRAIKKLKD